MRRLRAPLLRRRRRAAAGRNHASPLGGLGGPLLEPGRLFTGGGLALRRGGRCMRGLVDRCVSPSPSRWRACLGVRLQRLVPRVLPSASGHEASFGIGQTIRRRRARRGRWSRWRSQAALGRGWRFRTGRFRTGRFRTGTRSPVRRRLGPARPNGHLVVGLLRMVGGCPAPSWGMISRFGVQLRVGVGALRAGLRMGAAPGFSPINGVSVVRQRYITVIFPLRSGGLLA